MAATQTGNLTSWQHEIATHFAAKDTTDIRMEDLLCSFYLREDKGRAVIIQSKDRYAVFFLATPIFYNEEKKKEELEKFFELVNFIRQLKSDGRICLYRGNATNEKVMHFLQDGFANAQPSQSIIILNDKGDYTSTPDAIHDKTKNIIYKGVVFDNDYYEMINNSLTGALYVMPNFEQVQDAQTLANDEQVVRAIEPPIQDEIAKPVIKTHHVVIIIVFIIATLGLLAYAVYKMEELKKHITNTSNASVEAMRNTADSIAGAGPINNTEPMNNTPTAPDTVGDYYGIDISHWDGNIVQDLKSVDSLSFAICKATEGTSGIDPDFKKNWLLIRKKGLIRGAYHFYRVSEDPIAQAEHFCTVAGTIDSTDMPLIIDVESGSFAQSNRGDTDNMQDHLLKVLQHVERISGRTPMLYTNSSFSNQFLHKSDFGKYPLWLADYTKAAKPKIPQIWKDKGYKIWQRSDTVRISSFVVDYDIYHGPKKGLYISSKSIQL